VVLSTWNGAHNLLINTLDGGYAMAGSTLSTPTYTGQMYFIKLTHDLSLDFIKIIPLSIKTSSFGIVEVPDGYLIAGTDQYPDLILDPVVLKIDKQANLLWRKSYGTELWEAVSNIFKLSENEFVIIGAGGDWNGVIGDKYTYVKGMAIHIDSLGNELEFWESSKELGAIRNLIILPDSSWICVGDHWSYGPIHGDYFARALVFRMDKDKSLMWKKEFGKEEEEFLTSFSDIVMTKDSNYIISGVYTKGPDRTIHQKINADGDSLWMRRDTITQVEPLMMNPHTYVKKTTTLSTGSIITIGYTQRYDPAVGYGTYGFILKLSADGCMDTLNCWPVANNTPFAQAEEISVYPNPINDELMVDIKDYYPKDAYIYFYDVMGRFYRKERVRHGYNVLIVSDLPSGMIFYTILSKKGILKNGKLIKN